MTSDLINFSNRLLQKISKDDIATLAASLAFYTALSLAPVVVLFVTVASFVDDGLTREFIHESRKLMGPDAASTFETVISNAKVRADLASISGLIGLATLLLSAGLIFGQLRTALNRIFERETAATSGETYSRWLGEYVRARLLNIGVALSFVFSLIVSLIVSSVVATALGENGDLAALLFDFSISLALFTLIFTLVYRYLPEGRLSWRQAARGGGITAVLFVAGKQLIGIYLGNSALGSAYGAAGSLIVLLAWVYYSAWITLMGAEVSSTL